MTATLAVVASLDPLQLAWEIRAIIAVLLLFVVADWTWDRITGQDGDPTLSTSMFGQTGGLSLLVSGTHAVALVTGLATYLLWPTMAESPELLFIPVAIVMAHYYYEDKERRGGLFWGGRDD